MRRKQSWSQPRINPQRYICWKHSLLMIASPPLPPVLTPMFWTHLVSYNLKLTRRNPMRIKCAVTPLNTIVSTHSIIYTLIYTPITPNTPI